MNRDKLSADLLDRRLFLGGAVGGVNYTGDRNSSAAIQDGRTSFLELPRRHVSLKRGAFGHTDEGFGARGPRFGCSLCLGYCAHGLANTSTV